ncbi:MAG: type II toxin-antitoxin system VapC family toxin [Bdellovibrionales bacterium]
MKILLDTNSLIWILDGSDRIKATFQEIDGEDIYFSSLSLYEIAILQSIGRLKTTPAPSKTKTMALASGFRYLDIQTQCYDIYVNLPLHHKDPFDRMLIAQAIAQNCSIVTSDKQLKAYDVNVIAV